jgi:bis(5'-nucleosyl)-tetraphosphatase (symmetrical)
MRWIVGDIQGCAREFDDLLEQARFDPSRDELWCLGDLINRGPDSVATLVLWRDVGGRALLGNHEVNALRAHAKRTSRKNDTLDALFDSPDAANWFTRLRDLPVLVRLPGSGGATDAWIVHAGLDPRWNDLEAIAQRLNPGPHDDEWLESEEVSTVTRLRCCDGEGRQIRFTGPPGDCPEPFAPWDAFYQGPDLVVHGHWARRGYYRGERTMGLDSGCVYGGALTAWCQEEDRIVQIPSRESGHGTLRFDLGGT